MRTESKIIEWKEKYSSELSKIRNMAIDQELQHEIGYELALGECGLMEIDKEIAKHRPTAYMDYIQGKLSILNWVLDIDDPNNKGWEDEECHHEK